LPTAHFERNDVIIICETLHHKRLSRLSNLEGVAKHATFKVRGASRFAFAGKRKLLLLLCGEVLLI
jgi:hypothetical protein